MLTNGKQIAAARQLLEWSQADLAEKAGVSKPSIIRMEKDLFSVKDDSRRSVEQAFDDHNIEFIDGGARINQKIVTIIEGDDCYLRLLDDAYNTLSSSHGEFLRSGANERKSSSVILEKQQAMRNLNIPMRSLIKNGDTFVRGNLDEYRWVDDQLYVESDVKVIYGNKVAYFVKWNDSFRAIVIDDAHIAEENRRIFNYIWSISKKPSHSESIQRFQGVKV